MATKPAHEIRYGLIKACIWKNSSRSGTHYTVGVCRLFKNGDQWKESARFGRDDLLVLAKVVDEAHSWIHQHGKDE